MTRRTATIAMLFLIHSPLQAFDEIDALSGKKSTHVAKPIKEITEPASLGNEDNSDILFIEEETGSSEHTTAEAVTNRGVRRHSPSFTSDQIAFSLGLGFGGKSFFGKVSYNFNKYISSALSGFYLKEVDGDWQRYGQGGEVDFVLRLPTPTVFTPFAGAGPGYESWSQKSEDELFDDGNGFTGSYFFGILVSFSKNFGLSLSRNIKHYFYAIPKERNGNQTKNKDIASIDIAFQVVF